MDELIAALSQEPVLAKALQGSAREAAVRALGQAICGDDTAPPGAIATAIAAAPADLAQRLDQAQTRFLQGQRDIGNAARPAAVAPTDAPPGGTVPTDPGASAVGAAAALTTVPAPKSIPANAEPDTSFVTMEANAANERATTRQSNFATNDRTSASLAFLVTVGFLLAIVLIAVRGIDANEGALHIMLGVLGTGWVSVVTFYFGSSVGSKEKTALLGEATTPPKTTTIG